MSRLPRLLAAPVAAAALALTGGVAQAPASQAASGDPRLQLRLAQDAAWATSLPPQLFVGSGRLVPGGSVTDDIWVRNASADAARLTVRSDSAGIPMSAELKGMSLRTDVTAYPAGVTSGPVSGTTGGVVGSTVTFDQIDARDRALSSVDLAPGQQVHLVVRVAMPRPVGDVDGTQAEDGAWGNWLRLNIGLLQLAPGTTATSAAGSATSSAASPGAGAAGTGGPGHGALVGAPVGSAAAAGTTDREATASGNGPLAYTGADLLPALLTGAGLVSAGWFLVAAARRRRDDEDERVVSEV